MERAADFHARRGAAEATAKELEAALRQGEAGAAAAEASFKKVGADCTTCHARYRDPPRQP
jgi:cytochrome c556